MRKNLIAGAAILALLMNSPQISAADDDVVIFGKEFDDGEKEPHEVERPEPIRELPPPVDKPVEQPAPPVDKPVEQPAPPVDKPVEQPAPPVDKPVEQPAPPSPEPVNETPPVNDDDDDLGDILVFDDISRERIEQPVNETPPEPVQEPEPVDEPFKDQRPEPVETPPPVDEPVREPQPEPVQEPVERPSNAKLKQLKQRFVKLAVDETYIYYLDKTSVKWRKMPYSTSEYMADFWVRMIEREPQDNGDFYGTDDDSIEILSAREKGFRYRPEDEEILRRQSYVLEHYYLRPKTKQIQFLCELEVFGRPQNTIDEREYDYRNWEDLVPGSVESVIYASVVRLLDLTKDNPKGHMTVSDMLDEYLRISL